MFTLQAGNVESEFDWVTDAAFSVSGAFLSLWVPKIADAADGDDALTVSVAAKSGADGAELSFAPPELLSATAPVAMGCHAINGVAVVAIRPDMTPKGCIKTCLEKKKRFAYLFNGDSCACEDVFRADFMAVSEEKCLVFS